MTFCNVHMAIKKKTYDLVANGRCVTEAFLGSSVEVYSL